VELSCEHSNELSVHIKYWKIFSVVAQLAASQEEPISMEFLNEDHKL
jgi:hypothetical protein